MPTPRSRSFPPSLSRLCFIRAIRVYSFGVSDIVQRLWALCHTLRHGGVAFGQPGGRQKIAHRFIGGLRRQQQNESRQGRKNVRAGTADFFRPCGARTGLFDVVPAMNRRAIVGRPCGTKAKRMQNLCTPSRVV